MKRLRFPKGKKINIDNIKWKLYRLNLLRREDALRALEGARKGE